MKMLISLIAVALCGCASASARPRAELIADADRAARQAVASEQRLGVTEFPPGTIAILPFRPAEHDSLLTPLGFGLADLLANDLAVSPRLVVLERLHIDAVLRELALVDSGVIDPTSAPRVGRLMGSRRLLIGSVAEVPGGLVRLQARVVRVVDGTVQDLVTAEAPLARILDAEKSLALLLFDRLGVPLAPAERAAIERRQGAQLTAVLAFGRGAEAEAHGDASGATSAFAEATRLDASFIAGHTRAGAAPATVSSRGGVRRVLDLSTQALNQNPTRLSEAADVPLPSSLSVPLVLTIRVTP